MRLRITSFFLAFACKEGTKLEIRDGQSSSSVLLKTFCAEDYESSVFSSGRYLWVRFQSSDDEYQSGTGFNALFEAVTERKILLLIFFVRKIFNSFYSSQIGSSCFRPQ